MTFIVGRVYTKQSASFGGADCFDHNYIDNNVNSGGLLC